MTSTLEPAGSLAVRDVPDVVQALHQGGWTGVLTLTHMGVGRSITVQEGRLVFASSSSPDDRMGELLLRQGRLSLRQFVEASKSVGPGRRLGAILVDQEVLSPKDLVRGVVEQTREIIYGAFQWTEGQYRLREGSIPAESITLRISTPEMILEGIRRIASWARIHRAVGGPNARFERASEGEAVLASMNVSPEQRSLLASLADVRTVEQICEASPLPDFEVCRTLWAFRVIGAVHALDRTPASAAAPEDEGLDLVLPAD